MGRVGQAGIAIAHREPARLGLEMQPLGAVRVESAKLEPFQDVQHLQRDHALAVGRALEHLEAAIGGPDRGHEGAGGGRKILQRMQPALGLQEGHHVLGALAGVEGVAPWRAIASSVLASAGSRTRWPATGAMPSGR